MYPSLQILDTDIVDGEEEIRATNDAPTSLSNGVDTADTIPDIIIYVSPYSDSLALRAVIDAIYDLNISFGVSIQYDIVSMRFTDSWLTGVPDVGIKVGLFGERILEIEPPDEGYTALPEEWVSSVKELVIREIMKLIGSKKSVSTPLTVPGCPKNSPDASEAVWAA